MKLLRMFVRFFDLINGTADREEAVDRTLKQRKVGRKRLN